jgi:hypothetical protein
VYDALTTTYSFACPAHGEARVRLSGFRRLEELPGPHHPSVFRIDFGCACGGEHPGLVTHDELDLAPLGLEDDTRYVDLMTSHTSSVAAELADVAASRIRAGEWPWSFFCWPEERPRPAFPSAFRLLTAASGDRVAVAVCCPVCMRLSVNLVSRAHIDVPFHNDAELGVVEHLFAADVETTVEAFRAELYSSSFDTRRLALG